MNWEAFAVIGLFTLVLGIVLYVPAKLLINRGVRSNPSRYPVVRLTRLGWLLFIAALLALFGGFSAQHLAPESMLGQFMKVPGGQFLYTVLIGTAFWLVELALKTKGIYLTKNKPNAGSRGQSDASS